MKSFISGIQQVGIGVLDADVALTLYRDLLGMDALVFDDVAEAALMTRFTGNAVRRRRATLTLNMQGGGGFELWQHLNGAPQLRSTPARIGDLGITAVKINCSNVPAAHERMTMLRKCTVGELMKDLKGDQHFYIRDHFGNAFEVMVATERFSRTRHATGGVGGVVIGVSHMDRSLQVYRDVLGLSETVYDTRTFDENGPELRRVLLRKRSTGEGAFGRLLGSVQVELVQDLSGPRSHIYKDRYWGDPGFIHLCMDVLDMEGLKRHAATQGVQFAVDSQETFAMESAGGRFCYIKDPDGTLIELVETHRVPVAKKWGIFLNLKRRDMHKPLPDWIVRLLALNKVKG